jgi:hypothetical protein
VTRVSRPAGRPSLWRPYRARWRAGTDLHRCPAHFSHRAGPWPFSLTAGARLDVMVAAVYAIGMASLLRSAFRARCLLGLSRRQRPLLALADQRSAGKDVRYLAQCGPWLHPSDSLWAAESILMGGRVNSRWLQARDWTYFCDSRPCGIVVGIGGFEAPQPIIGTPLQQVLHKRPTW